MFRSFNNVSLRLNEFLATSQRKTYFITFATLLFVIVITLGGILPAFSALSFQAEENIRRESAIAKIEQKLQTAKLLNSEYSSSNNYINYFNSIFPNKIEQQYLITRIGELVGSKKSFVSAINFSDAPSSNFLKSDVSLDVNAQILSIFLEGNLSDLQSIVKEFEDSGRILNIQNIFYEKKDILRQQQENFQRGDATMSLQVEVYYFKSNLI